MAYPLLDSIDNPSQLRELNHKEIKQLADELRQYIIDQLNICGGHFGANLGAVELAVALHYVFHTPHDKLIWDVGHQAYPHKVLTGRRDQLHTIKQPGGLAPFPKREESIFDAFGTGHSSTSISAALGMAVAFKQNQRQEQAIAIIGDGGLTGGMAFEALNHAGSIDANLLVVLNDNDMSISKNVGALNNYLTRVLSGKAYNNFRETSKKMLDIMPPMKTLVKRTETHMKGMFAQGTLFEELGFLYYGPIDGHDLSMLIPTLENLKQQQGPKLLHVVTVKGKGYPAAEADQIKYHAVSPGFKNANDTSTKNDKKITYSDVFGEWLCDMAEQDENLIAVTPAMCEGSGMVEYSQRFADRFFDVAIAEQHAVTFAAGLACENKKPVVAIYSTFLQRAYDQLIHDVALQNLDVTFAIDRGGLVGSDGPTHSGRFDLTYLRCLPNVIVMTPSDENEARQMLFTAYLHPGPAAVRYPRGSGPGVSISKTMQTIDIGKAKLTRQGNRIAILAFGSMLTPAMQAADELNATVINMRFVKPIDMIAIKEAVNNHDLIVTVEENTIQGGAGSAVSEAIAEMGLAANILHLGLPDHFLDHGIPSKMLSACGLDAKGIVSSIKQRLSQLQVEAAELAS